jgi:hypothetical protein
MLQPKFLYIKDLFQKEDKYYTQEALLYQNILEFPLKTDIEEFKFWDLGPTLAY